jgi:hypothetical protein
MAKKPNVPIRQELVDYLQEIFPPPKVLPGVDRDTIMFQAGQQAVIEEIQRHVGKTGDLAEMFPDLLK